MSTKNLPIISITEDHPPQSDSESDDESNDMDYNFNSGRLTDVEDFDSSQAEIPMERPSYSPRPKSSHRTVNSKADGNDDVTDIEDYNDSDDLDEDEQKSAVYPELKMSLQEFLQHGQLEQAVYNDETQAKCEFKAGSFLQAQNLNNCNDYLTDCEDYNTDSELEQNCDKSVCVDLDKTIDGTGRVCITDADKRATVRKPKQQQDGDGDEDADDDDDVADAEDDVSVVSDIADLESIVSDVPGFRERGMSEDELMELSGNPEVCSIAYSGSSLDSKEEDLYVGAGKSSVPAIDVTFIGGSGDEAMAGQRCARRCSTAGVCAAFLDVTPSNEEVLTDVERLDDSAAEDEDSFGSEEDNNRPIPRAVILAADDDGMCETDCEEFVIQDESQCSSSGTAHVPTVADKVIPPPHREMILLKEDKFGDTVTNVMPMDKEYQFGIYNRCQDEVQTDTEDYSATDECDRTTPAVAADVVLPTASDFIEGEVIIANETLKPSVNKRSELHSNTESVTDVEEIYVAGTNRRRKQLKTRSMSNKGKSPATNTPPPTTSKYLEVTRMQKNNPDAVATDIEDMDLSDCDVAAPHGKGSADELNRKSETGGAQGVTDIEDLTGDDVTGDDFSEAGLSDAELHGEGGVDIVHDYQQCSQMQVTATEVDKTQAIKLKTLTIHKDNDPESYSQPHTDIEDVQVPSDAEDAESLGAGHPTSNCDELNDMLNESYTVVHEKSINTFDVEAEKLHIKGMAEPRDSHTDVEYVESDESAARGGN